MVPGLLLAATTASAAQVRELIAQDKWRESLAAAREVGEPEGSNIPLADLFVKKYGMRAGNIVGTGTYKPDYVPPDGAVAEQALAEIARAGAGDAERR